MAATSWADRFANANLDLTGVYETVMVPRMFAPWAEVLIDALAPAPGTTVIDVATGPGTVARAVARRVGVLGRVIGCDISPGMLAAAAQHPADGSAAPIEYLQCQADALAVADSTADAVTCQHGLQFFPDRVAALIEMRRVTRPGGRLAVGVWTAIEFSPLFAALASAIATVLGPDAGAGYRAGPYSLSDRDTLADLACAAGWHDVEVTPQELPLEFDGGPAQLIATLGVTPLGERVDALDESGRRAILDAVTDALGHHLGTDGVIRSPTSAQVLLATA